MIQHDPAMSWLYLAGPVSSSAGGVRISRPNSTKSSGSTFSCVPPFCRCCLALFRFRRSNTTAASIDATPAMAPIEIPAIVSDESPLAAWGGVGVDEAGGEDVGKLGILLLGLRACNMRNPGLDV